VVNEGATEKAQTKGERLRGGSEKKVVEEGGGAVAYKNREDRRCSAEKKGHESGLPTEKKDCRRMGDRDARIAGKIDEPGCWGALRRGPQDRQRDGAPKYGGTKANRKRR